MKPQPALTARPMPPRRRRNSGKAATTDKVVAAACIATASLSASLVMVMEPADIDTIAGRWPFEAALASFASPQTPVPVFAPVLARMDTSRTPPLENADKRPLQPAAPAPQSPRTRQQAALPTPDQTVYLVRATLIALDHANRTGNYSVLRELASTNFQLRNGADHLAGVFSEMRRSRIDMTAAALHKPHWLAQPALTKDNRLSLRGTMPALPSAVEFDVHFSIEAGSWKLDSIAIAPAKTQTAANG